MRENSSDPAHALPRARQHVGHARGQALGVVEVQEFVRAVGVGVRAEHASDQELRARKLAPSIAMKGMVPPSPIHIALLP